VEGQTLVADIASGGTSFDQFVEAADYAVIEDAYRRAGRIISPDLATSYSEHLAKRNGGAEDEEDALIDAHTDIAALGLIDAVKDQLEQRAEDLGNDWLGKYQTAIANLSDKRQDVYREVGELSANPFDVELVAPNSRLQPTKAIENGQESDLPSFSGHLLCDKDGRFPDVLNEWETKVLSVEMARDGRIGWYRNPPRAAPESLGIVYDDAGNNELLRPDFIFFSKGAEGDIVAEIVDPHGHHLADALPKLHGLVRYADRYGHLFNRIEAMSEVGGEMRVLDLQNKDVVAEVLKSTSAKALYEGAAASKYDETELPLSVQH
ncbi:MAG: hypothetical protein ABJP82_06855, partial [Hyphomicrobiales bacterium]